jgi:tyrocidine synthetase-3
MSGQQEVLVGAPIAGRRHADLEQIIGMFVNTLVLRNFPRRELTFTRFLGDLKERTLGAFDNQEYQFEDLVEAAGVKRDAGRNPLFDVVYILQNIGDLPVERDISDEAAPEPVESAQQAPPPRRDNRTAKFDITLMLHEQPDTLHAMFQYSTRLFKEETIQRFIAYFNNVLAAVVNNPAAKLSDIELIPEAEKKRILEDFNRTETAYPGDKTIGRLFEEQAAKTPDRIALIGENRSNRSYRTYITYKELNRRSGDLAFRLKEKGVVSKTIVALQMERSMEMIAAIMGILKAGGAYLPIEPGYPQERIEYMLRDSGAGMWITDRGVKYYAPASKLQPQSAAPGAEDLAYIIYTSGSTGKPKGVLTMHYNVTRVVKDTNYIDLDENDRLLQLSNYAFDGSVFDIYGALLNGGALVIVPPKQGADVGKLSAIIRREWVTVFFVTTALFNLMVDEAPEIFEHIRKILFGGERVSVSHARRALEIAGKGKILHVYGPTETTVYASYYPIDEVEENAVTIPIGYPLSNTAIYILDKQMNVVPVGLTGELYIGGAGTARGYLNRPELTAEVFIPWQGETVVYKTGDLGRWLPNGNIEFLGRVDFQVKVRGFRIELGEIESELLKLEEIKEAVVIALENDTGDKTLCAYIVPSEDGHIIETVFLKGYLSRSLPAYMIPSYFVPLAELPLNPNGKVDRKRLPLPGLESAAGAYAAPVSELEHKLVDIWSGVLGMDPETVGIDSDFFEMGGHSLKATVMVSRVHRACDVKLPLAEVFRTPTIRELACYIEGLKQEKFAAVQAVEKREYYPLSSAQKRLYVLQQVEPDSTAYNVPYAGTMEGEIDVEVLENIFRRLIRRHESLRTSFHMLNDRPVQRIHDEVEFNIGLIGTIVPMETFVRPFDLARAPLLRVQLSEIADTGHGLMVDMHHIITDGTSMDLLVKEFMALAGGEELPPLKLQYKDYSQWQNSETQRVALEKQEEYWLDRFAGEIPVLHLPVDFPRPAIQVFEGAAWGDTLSIEESAVIRKLAADTGATLYMVLLSLYTVLLAKISGQEDIVVGTPVAARRHADLEPIIGMFVNTLALRNYPAGEKEFKAFLEEVKTRTLEAFENQEYQFEDLVDRLDVPRDAGRNPLFDVFFSVPNMNTTGPAPPPQPPQRPPETQPTAGQQTVKFDLSFTCLEAGDTIRCSFQYCTRLFKPETVLRMWGYFKKIFAAVREDESVLLSNIDIISEEEKHRILYEFNDTSSEYPGEKLIHHMFEDQAARTPERIAILGNNRSYRSHGTYLTYKELDRQSTHLSRYLRQKGAADIVAVNMERSIEMIIAIMAILKAGSAYLPIEPGYPVERIQYILKDSNASMVLTSPLEWDETPRSGGPETSGAASLAYIIYTSGSTGKPKGVAVEHGSAMNVLDYLYRTYPFTENDAYLFKTSYIFDVSVSELFGWYWDGGRLAVLENGAEKDPGRIIDAIEEHKVSHINFVPSMFTVFVDALNPTNINRLASLKYIFLAGEALPPAVVRRFRELDRHISLENIYGPTEGTIYVSKYSLSEWTGEGGIPIGCPVQNIMLYIFDRHGHIQPIGVAGELCIGGAGVARGYLNRPELTAEKFTNNGSLYKTGDLARWWSDGNIEFLGRLDHQVKVRGYRIELGEIESCLLSHETVKEAVVVAGTDVQGGQRLCAYIVPRSPGAGLNVNELKRYLSHLLPEYMLPSSMTGLEKLPLTPSGKVNRKDLPAPVFTAGEGHTASRDTVEKKLAFIWSEVLGVPDASAIGIDDHFFQAGGHSLSATVMVTKIHKAFDVKLSLGEIFKTPRIRELAVTIKGMAREEFSAIDTVEKKDFYPLSSAQKRLYILQQIDVEGVAYNMPMTIPLPGDVPLERLEQTFKKLILRHESLRTSFHLVQDQPVQRIHDNVEFKIEHSEPGASAVRHFDLAQAPLLRVTISQTGESWQLLMVDMHHIISDGLSLEILSNDFMLLYEGKALPPLKIQYKDYAHWQHSRRRRRVIRDQELYWLKRLEGEIPVLALPTDFPRPEIQGFEGSFSRFVLSEEDSRGLHGMAYETGATMFMVLLSVFTLFVSKLGGDEDIIAGAAVAGRGHTDLEPVMGMFVNTLALRHFPAGQKSFRDYLDEVKALTLEDFDNQEYQFEDLVDRLAVERDTSRNPLFDVMFSLQTRDDAAVPDKTTDTKALDPAGDWRRRTSKFDLSLDITATPRQLHASLQYCTQLFKEETIVKFGNYFRQLVSGILAHPLAPVNTITLLSDREKETLLTTFNDTAVDYPSAKTLHQLFEEQAGRTPEYIASIGELTGENRSYRSYRTYLTYKELDRRSGSIAQELREKGVGPGSIAAVKIGRSVDMIIALLGILKAGGAYLPISPEHPEERIDYMLRDSAAGVLVTEEGAAFIPGGRVTPGSGGLAYIIYTSGTTGQPKGVMIEHPGAVNVVTCFARTYGLKPGIRLLNLSDYTFDASVDQVFGTLLHGAELHVIPPDLLLDIHGLRQYIYDNNINVINFVPMVLHQLLSHDEKIPSLDIVISGAEKLDDAVKDGILSRGYRLYNHYGPTEASVDTLTCECRPDESVHLGRPVANLQCYVLDKYQQLQPIGVPGELYIAGTGLARGYLNQPELTARKFTPVGAIHESPLLLYKTGDKVRWLPEGNIQFLGRIDHQVKVRGFRVELGEIRSRLGKHPQIAEAVVVMIDGPGGDKQLCAYVTAVEKEIDIQSLNRDISRFLPDYMMPAYIVPLERLPRTPGGKVALRRLPAPGIDSGRLVTEPRDDIEKKLLAIWSGVLFGDTGGDAQVLGIDDNFFHLGGHSLKATIMVSRVHRACNVKVPLVEVFRTPTIRGLARYIGGLGEEKFAAVQAAEKREYYSLSPAQKRLYVLQQVKHESTAYNVPYAVTLDGEIDVEALENVFKRLIRRHESLRTSFHMLNDRPVQRVHDDVEFKIGPIGPMENFVRPFDLACAPLMRVQLSEIAGNRHLLMVDMHHIITDGVSMDLLVKEFTTLAGGEELPPLKLQYKDYSQWQNSETHRVILERQEEYWKNRFAGEIPVLHIPTDFSRPAIQVFEGAAWGGALSIEESVAIRKLSEDTGATIYMVLLSLYTVLLAKISGQEDIVVGTPVAARRHTDLESIIGMFVNTLALRNYPAGEKEYKAFLEEVKINTLEAFENQEYQFEDLVDHLDVPRDAGRNPLFDVFFSMPNMNTARPAPRSQPSRQPSEPKLATERQTAKFDLSLTCIEAGDTINCSFNYCTRLFKPETVRRMWGYFQKIIAAVRGNESVLLSNIDITSEEERQRILYEFNDTYSEYPGEKRLHTIFEDQALKTPERIALVGNNRSYRSHRTYLTYKELDRQANGIAHELREKGVGPGSITAIKIGRSVDMIIALLGILKAGGAYLPISPGHPQERIDYMLRDSAAGVLVTEEGAVCRPGGRVTPGSAGLAYIIYTSGTTGQPKGVMIEHHSAVNVVIWYARTFGLKPGQRMMNLSDYTFDASVNQVFGPLLHGAELHVTPPDMILDIRGLRQYIYDNNINTIHFVPMVLHQLLSHDEKLPSLDIVISGAEKLDDIVKDGILSRGYRLYNLYGPTEATVDTLAAECRPDEPVHLGRPVANLLCYILDKHQRLQPIGVPGELYIAGTGLARGYLNQPELTAEKFTPVEAIHESPLLLYKTGDKVRWLPEGNIQFLGRIDHQVKIRGFRVELGEIQSRLAKHPQIAETVVVMIDGPGGDKQLCAYVTAAENEIDIQSLRQDLSRFLPDYMMPAYIVPLERIPLTPGGKVARRRLPAPGIDSGRLVTGPRDDMEKKLLGIWSGVLYGDTGEDAPVIGIDDNFFHLGGHSLKATIMTSRLQRELGVHVPLGEVFKNPTVRHLAQTLKGLRQQPETRYDDDRLVLLKWNSEFEHARSLFLVHDGSGEVEGYVEFCNCLTAPFNCWGIRSDRLDDYAPRNLTIESVAENYIETLRKVQPDGPYYIAGWSMGGTIAFEMVRQLEQQGQTAAFLALIDVMAPEAPDSLPGFSIDSELAFVQRYLPGIDSLLQQQPENIPGLDGFWQWVVDFLDRQAVDPDLIRKIVREYEAHVVPAADTLTTGQLVRYLNTGRTFRSARRQYVPQAPVNAAVHYFAASRTREAGVIDDTGWNSFCLEPVHHREISGDHFSIFKKPAVIELAEQFSSLLEDNLTNSSNT